MEYIGNKKKQGSIVELLRDEILAGKLLPPYFKNRL